MKSYDKPPLIIIERENPNTGFKESRMFLGFIYQKPKGWRIIKIIRK